LAKYPDGHRETYALCEEYLQINEREMRTVGPGSPRIAALIKGKQYAEELHYFHMLQWAELEVRSLTHESSRQTKTAEKIGTAQTALEIIAAAADHYPNEPKLRQSAEVILDYIAGLKVGDLMARAERALGKGRALQAEKLFGQALSEITERSPIPPELETAAATIDEELRKIRKLKG
jgi:hypothetical protein